MIKKVIIFVGGYGMRNFLVMKVILKEMFLVGFKFVIYYIVEELKELGIEDILMVVLSYKNLIVDYFDFFLVFEVFLVFWYKLYLFSEYLILDIWIYYVW